MPLCKACNSQHSAVQRHVHAVLFYRICFSSRLLSLETRKNYIRGVASCSRGDRRPSLADIVFRCKYRCNSGWHGCAVSWGTAQSVHVDSQLFGKVIGTEQIDFGSHREPKSCSVFPDSCSESRTVLSGSGKTVRKLCFAASGSPTEPLACSLHWVTPPTSSLSAVHERST